MHVHIYIYTCHQCVCALPYIKISILYMVNKHMWSILCCACDAYYHVVVRCMCCQEHVQYKQVQKHKHSIHLCKFRQNVKGIQICNDIIWYACIQFSLLRHIPTHHLVNQWYHDSQQTHICLGFFRRPAGQHSLHLVGVSKVCHSERLPTPTLPVEKFVSPFVVNHQMTWTTYRLWVNVLPHLCNIGY